MHYYQFNIADFRAATGHLSLLERGVYRELLDWYYLDEKPIPLETQWVSRRFPTETQLVITILEEFFQKTENGWHHRRVDLEINNYRHNVEKNRINGKLGGRPKKTGWVNLANPNETQTKANQEPITKNHEKKTPFVSRDKIAFDGSTFQNINGHLRVWESAYPAVDVLPEINKAAAWLVANPKNKKSQYARFLNGWLSRAQDRAPRKESPSLFANAL